MSRLETFVDVALLVALARRIISGGEIRTNSGDEIPANSGSEIPTNITGLAGAVPALPQSS